jgi:predicted metal-binding protein
MQGPDNCVLSLMHSYFRPRAWAKSRVPGCDVTPCNLANYCQTTRRYIPEDRNLQNKALCVSVKETVTTEKRLILHTVHSKSSAVAGISLSPT